MKQPAGKAAAKGVTLHIRKIGNSIGLILPKDFAARHDFKEGDTLHVVEQPGGAVTLSPYDPAFAKAMQIARKGMKIYRNALAELAK